jgi:hypothetical protein
MSNFLILSIMSKFIDVISKGVKHSINVSQIVVVQEYTPQETAIFVTQTGGVHCIGVMSSFDDVMKLIRE